MRDNQLGKKKWLILVSIGVLLVLLMTIGVDKMSEPPEKERQIAFLKEHENKMTEYVKSQNPKIQSVKYEWDSVKVADIGNGTPRGAGKLMTINGRFNDIKESNFILSFGVDEKNMPKLDTIGLLSSLYVGGMIYE
ncbi:hypothetical protein [Enterococcus mundtii]|uniref:hypothetical protein n=1 Tax=Enterococcus mundtii TaxID=53346 RepID=UPI000445BDC6|nr:hypothetical protein [Enterococcus mundtii]AZP93305.1 hypothetical protein CYK55_09505 [Enterococcus mundtii]EYT96693.1 hypothetical protein AK89_02330 [Enterococcus mundtii CRL35]